MNTKILILIVVVVGAAGFGFFLFSNNADNELPKSDGLTSQVPAPGNEGVDEMVVEPPSGTITFVTYTDSGFSPKDITITKGEIVLFINESSESMWPASAAHPTHSVYPEKTDRDCSGSVFDSCRSLSIGESWNFTFNQVGKWGYHNHSRAGNTGTVTVK